jgi:hypothetical protein
VILGLDAPDEGHALVGGNRMRTCAARFVFPANATLIQIIAGTGALLAVTAVGALGLGTILRTSAGAVTAGIVLFVLPNLVGPGVLGQGGSGGFTTALYRFSRAAAWFGVADRTRRDLGSDLDTVAASWTIVRRGGRFRAPPTRVPVGSWLISGLVGVGPPRWPGLSRQRPSAGAARASSAPP